jgi:hypothetical protein
LGALDGCLLDEFLQLLPVFDPALKADVTLEARSQTPKPRPVAVGLGTGLVGEAQGHLLRAQPSALMPLLNLTRLWRKRDSLSASSPRMPMSDLFLYFVLNHLIILMEVISLSMILVIHKSP